MRRRASGVRILIGFLALVWIAELAGGWVNLFGLTAVGIGIAGGVQYVLRRRAAQARPQAATPGPSARRDFGAPTHSRQSSAEGKNINPEHFAALVPQQITHRSGSVFYSGRAAFSQKSRLYILGLNPGGSPISQAAETIARDLERWRQLPLQWSAYSDESWLGRPPGTWGMQPRLLHMLRGLGLDPRLVPASNVIFVRSATEAALAAEKRSLLPVCWRVHRAVINELGVDTVLCFGGTAGKWVRDELSAQTLVAEFAETNARGWRSSAHKNSRGQVVATLTHPGRANWCNSDADPTPFVARLLAR